MEKKIFSVSLVKNEVDIIESFVRYNLNIFDGMIILDNGSTDHTLTILKLLKNEGLPIYIFKAKNSQYQQAKKTNQLVLKAIDEFEADIIIPLDADEFIISLNGENPRETLAKIDKSNYYLVKWKTYVPYFDMNENKKFIPSKLTYSRYDKYETVYKVVIPKELVENYSVKVKMGNHDLTYDLKHENSIKSILKDDLRIAHYPIRSKEQCLTKIAIGWINVLTEINRTKFQSWHWERIFNKLKESEDLEKEDFINFAKEFDLINPPSEIKIKKDPINLSFCTNLEMKYSDYKIYPIAEILKSSENISLKFLNYQKDTIAEKKRLNNKINEIINEKNLEEERLKTLIKKYENSNSWRITAPLRIISSKIRKK